MFVQSSKRSLKVGQPFVSDVIVAVAEIHRSQKILNVRCVEVGDEGFEEGHFFARIFEDNARIL